LRGGQRCVEVGLTDAIVKIARAELVFSQSEIGVYAEVMFVGIGRSDGGEIADGNCIAVDIDRAGRRRRAGILRWRDWELLQDVDDCAVEGQSLHHLQPFRGRKRYLRTGCSETFILEFVGAKNEPFIVNYWSANRGAGAIVVETIFGSAVLLLVVKSV